jgi:hypothetical protein
VVIPVAIDELGGLPGLVTTCEVIASITCGGHREDEVERRTTMPVASPSESSIPRWLRFVLKADRAGSSWYIGTGFFFAPILALLSPWPTVTTIMWAVIAVTGLWLGLLGIAMATGLAVVLRSGQEIPENYWHSIIDYPTTTSR